MRYFARTEVAIATVIVVVLYLSPRIFDRAIGYPSADERLALAAMGWPGTSIDAALADGATVDSRDDIGVTPLMEAASCGNVSAARRLLELGADINAVDKRGRTAVMMAVADGKAEMARFLLQNGCDPSLWNRKENAAMNVPGSPECLDALDAVRQYAHMNGVEAR